MFKVTFLCDDKYLADILRSLAGKARNVEPVPVVNVAQGANGHLKQDAEHTLGLFLKELRKQGGDAKSVNALHARAATSACGLSPTSYSYFLQNAIKKGLLKKGPKPGTGNRQTYLWV